MSGLPIILDTGRRVRHTGSLIGVTLFGKEGCLEVLLKFPARTSQSTQRKRGPRLHTTDLRLHDCATCLHDCATCLHDCATCFP